MKTGVVYSFQDSSWFSVTKIVSNLLKSYKLAIGSENIVPINYSTDLTDAENKSFIQAGLTDEVSRLVILDHRPHPRRAFEWIGQERLKQLDELIVHVFGDFTLNLAEWRACEKYLQGVKLKFVCASDKQVSLIQKFVNQKTIVTKCPFPVDSHQFQHDPSQRASFRKKFGLREEDFIFLYVGRMSLQKNIEESVRSFLELKKRGELTDKHKFWLAGEFDVIGNPYVEDRHVLGEYFRKIQHLLDEYPESVRKDVAFLGAIPNEELGAFYNGCDRFFSLSSYQDEDYGMAIAEACMCGLPCALSDWAGYSSFGCADVKNFVNYAKIDLGVHRATVGPTNAKILMRKSSTPLSNNEKKKAAVHYNTRLSVEACSETLKDLFNCPALEFEGFSELLLRLGAISAFKQAPFMNEMNKTLNEFYYKVYDVYAE